MGKQKKKADQTHNGRIASNKKAFHDYEIIEKFEAGLVLKGSEVKTLRNGRANIAESHVSIDDNGEAWVENMSIPPYSLSAGNKFFNHEERRKRKLLLHNKEILKLKRAIEAKGMTIVPLSLYFLKGRAKIEIALARGKKLHDKRETIKKRDIDKAINKELKWR